MDSRRVSTSHNILFTALDNPQKIIKDQTYQIWKTMLGTGIRCYLKPNMLVNICRDIVRYKRHTDADKTKYEIEWNNPSINQRYDSGNNNDKDELKTKINEIRNNNLSGNKTE